MIYSLFAKHLYFPFLDLVKRADFHAALRQAEHNQYRPRSELAELQLRKLREIVAHAEKNCAYYTTRFREHGLAASDLSTLEDLRRFPLLSKEDVFHNRAAMISPSFEGRLFAASTSGSTGVALQFHLDSGQHAWADACQWRGRRWWHLERGDTQLLLWSRPVAADVRTQFKSWAKYRLRNYVQFDAFQAFDDAKVNQVIAAIRRSRPRFIFGYGSSIARVAGALEQRNEVLAGRERPMLVEYTADHLHEAERQVATQRFAAPVVSAYGASECGGVAQECREGNLHVSVDHAVVEFLRPNGSPADAEETAEIVLTTLNNRGMPLIRYRIGDLGSYSLAECRCGITLPLMRLQAGKAVDLVTTSTRAKVSAHLFDYINIHIMKQGIRGIRQFLVEQTALDRFVLSIVCEQPFDARCVEVFIERMKGYLGDQIEVSWQVVESIPLQPSGKRRYFKKHFQEASQ